jgi:hypothetical protein
LQGRPWAVGVFLKRLVEIIRRMKHFDKDQMLLTLLLGAVILILYIIRKIAPPL